MRQKISSLLRIIVFFNVFSITFYVNSAEDINLNSQNEIPRPSQQPAPAPRPTPPPRTKPQIEKDTHKIEIEQPYHSHKKIEEPKHNKVNFTEKEDYRKVSQAELQRMISTLPANDQKIMKKIQEDISNWPESIFKEVRNYNEFMIAVNKQAKEKYMKLSNGARQVLETEQELKKQLSTEAINMLSKLKVTP